MCVCGKQETLSIYLLQVGLFFVDIFCLLADRIGIEKKHFLLYGSPDTSLS